ncbi:hypothetical protein J3A64_003552 [Pseudarthrobacter sp. PvP004]|nr:hypothetical protein [Pseudarthrobacter sp. PvP004]
MAQGCDGRLIRYPLLHLQPPHAPLKHQRRTHSRQTHQRLRVQTAEKGATAGSSGTHCCTCNRRTHPLSTNAAPTPAKRTRGYGCKQRKRARRKAAESAYSYTCGAKVPTKSKLRYFSA